MYNLYFKIKTFINFGEIYAKFQTLVHAEKQVGILLISYGLFRLEIHIVFGLQLHDLQLHVL